MPVPTYDPNHTAEALGLLTDIFKNKPNISGLISSIVPSVQDLEDAINSYLTNILLANAQGVTLDTYGAIVGITRGLYTDAQFRTAISLQIRVLRSEGLAEDVIQVAILASQLQGGSAPQYTEFYPASFLLEIFDITDPGDFALFIGKTRQAGTSGILHYTTWPTTSTSNLVLTSHFGGVTPQGTLDSFFGGVSTRGLLAASATV